MAATAPSERLTSLSQPEEVARRNLWKEALHRLFLNRLATLGLIVVVLFILAGLVGPYITPYDFLEQEIDNALAKPTAQHWLGTDALGRDILSRLLHGARTAAFVGFFTTAISLLIGIVLGGIAGYVRGLADEFLMWLTDVTMSVPGLLLAMLMNTALKRPIAAWFDDMYIQTKNPFYLDTLWLDFVLVFGALAFISWPGFARLLRGQVLSVRETLYVEAARAIGVDERRILTHYIIPNAIGPIIVIVTAGVGGAITLESGLSFLGIGVQPPNASWGSMLSDSFSLWISFPHLMIIPAATIGVIVLVTGSTTPSTRGRSSRSDSFWACWCLVLPLKMSMLVPATAGSRLGKDVQGQEASGLSTLECSGLQPRGVEAW
ncbi:MAG: ABC transporter permease [Caldilineaceae bacterium]|nr:ABC transporter permease [Caldilineaceae bacterium]